MEQNPPHVTHSLYRKGDTRTLNISPPLTNQFLEVDTTEERLMKFTNWWIKKMGSTNGFKFKLYLEISKYGLLHWHGKILIQNPIQTAHSIGKLKYKDQMRIELDTIKDIKVWDDYITKDNEIMKTIISNKSRPTKGILQWMDKKEQA